MSTVRDPRAAHRTEPEPGESSRGEPVRLLRAPFLAAGVSIDELVGFELEPGTRDVARRLFAHGASVDFVRSIVGEVQAAGGRGAHALDRAAEALARAVPALPSPKRPRAGAPVPLIAVVGPTGVGKTTVLVELGRRLAAAGRRVGHAGLDPATFEALEQRRRLFTGERDVAWLDGDLDAVLFDTPGLSPREPERIAFVARELSRRASSFELRTLIVLSCAAARNALALTLQALAPFGAHGAVLTKLDETDEPSAGFEALARAGLPLAFLSEGREGRANLVRATGETLPELLLGSVARRTPATIPT